MKEIIAAFQKYCCQHCGTLEVGDKEDLEKRLHDKILPRGLSNRAQHRSWGRQSEVCGGGEVHQVLLPAPLPHLFPDACPHHHLPQLLHLTSGTNIDFTYLMIRVFPVSSDANNFI